MSGFLKNTDPFVATPHGTFSVSGYLLLRFIVKFTIKPTKVIVMHSIYKSTAVLLLMLPLSGISFAAEPQKAAEPAPGMGMHAGMDMNKPQGAGMGMHGMGMMSEEHLRAMQEHMLQMHDLSNQILAEKDPAKKEQLKKQQLELMKAHQAKMMQHHQMMMQEHK